MNQEPLARSTMTFLYFNYDAPVQRTTHTDSILTCAPRDIFLHHTAQVYMSKVQLVTTNLLQQSTNARNRTACSYPGCSQTFTRRSNLTTHLKTHQQNRPRSYKCSICNKGFNHQGNLDRHIASHGEDRIQCPFTNCARTFTRKDAVYRHLRGVHKKHII